MVSFGGPGMNSFSLLAWRIKKSRKTRSAPSAEFYWKWKHTYIQHTTQHTKRHSMKGGNQRWQPNLPMWSRFLCSGALVEPPFALRIDWLGLLLEDWIMWTKTWKLIAFHQRSLSADGKALVSNSSLQDWEWGKRMGKVGHHENDCASTYLSLFPCLPTSKLYYDS